jgi:hypothetical protein
MLDKEARRIVRMLNQFVVRLMRHRQRLTGLHSPAGHRAPALRRAR